MPQIEDLPLPGQRQLLAQRGQAPAETQGDVKRRGLFERLAAFGISRQEETATHGHTPRERQSAPPPQQNQRPQLPNPVHHEYAKRPNVPASQRQPSPPVNAPARPALPSRTTEEDQLEIPAFLRRQSN
jgi:cell division protein FtsZ